MTQCPLILGFHVQWLLSFKLQSVAFASSEGMNVVIVIQVAGVEFAS